MAAIGEREAKQIVSSKGDEGRCLLAQLMDLGPYKEERNMQNSILADFYYDHLKFAADKGFPWEQVCSIVQFAKEFLATATDNTIAEAVCLYQAQSPNLLMEVGERNYKVYTDFLFSTFFSHFQLFKYVLAHPRQENIPQVEVDVHPPVPPVALAEAKEHSVWHYEQSLGQLEEREREATQRRLNRQEQTEREVLAKKTAVTATVETVATPFTKESLEEMMRSLLGDYVAATGKAITGDIQDVREDLGIKLQKTSVPRPAVLGPPPRFKPKSPIQPLHRPSVTGAKGDKKNKSNNAADKPKSPKSPKSPARSRASSSRNSKR